MIYFLLSFAFGDRFALVFVYRSQEQYDYFPLTGLVPIFRFNECVHRVLPSLRLVVVRETEHRLICLTNNIAHLRCGRSCRFIFV